MLPKKFRLKVVEFYKNPQKSLKFVSVFFLFMLKKRESGNARFCITVPKSVDKRSAYRHRTKRIIVEVIRGYLDRYVKPADILIRMKKLVGPKDKNLLCREIERLLPYEKPYPVFDKPL